jgi:chitinase
MKVNNKNSARKFLSLFLGLVLFFSVLGFSNLAAAADKGTWAPNTTYATGDVVTYNGNTYTCLQGHTSLPGWEPTNVAALWKAGGTAAVATPAFNPAPGTYNSTQTVAISCATTGATIRYTTDSSEPTESSAAYASPLTISATTTIKAKAFKSGMVDSATASGTYTINTNAVATPIFSPAGGYYANPQSVTISCSTSGATIRYTTDNSTPTSTSPVYSGAISVTKSTTIKAIAQKAEMPDSNVATETYTIGNSLQKRILIGYWHTWGGDASGGVPFVKLRDVDPNWDVINIAFAEPVTPGSTNGKMKFEVTGLTSSYTINDFKADIKALQSKGKKVVLSIGGYTGYFSLITASAATTFANDIKGFIDEYGFDGIDIDLEQTSVEFINGSDPDFKNPVSPKIVNMISGIRQICDSYGSNFILSWAPETFYLQLGYQYYGGLNSGCDRRAGVYIPMIYALRDKTTYVHAQLYNSIQVMGLDGKYYSMGNSEAVVAMCEMLLKGFNCGGNSSYFFPGLRPDQIAIGVPSSQGSAGSGHISNAQLQQAFSNLNATYPTLRGIMTWSINWDAFQNSNSFAKSNGVYLDSLP